MRVRLPSIALDAYRHAWSSGVGVCYRLDFVLDNRIRSIFDYTRTETVRVRLFGLTIYKGTA